MAQLTSWHFAHKKFTITLPETLHFTPLKIHEAELFLTAITSVAESSKSSSVIKANGEAAKETSKNPKTALTELKHELETAERDAKRLKRRSKARFTKTEQSLGRSRIWRSISAQQALPFWTVQRWVIARDNQFKKVPASYDDVLSTLKTALDSNASGITNALEFAFLPSQFHFGRSTSQVCFKSFVRFQVHCHRSSPLPKLGAGFKYFLYVHPFFWWNDSHFWRT